MTYCWCQRAYDTGLTGDARVDRALQAHFDFGTLQPDWFRRAYEHYASGKPYKGAPRSAYCFSARRRGDCPASCESPARCDHARYRPTDLAARARFFIERRCPAALHYGRLMLEDELGSDTDVAVPESVAYDFYAVNSRTGVPRFPQGVRTVPASDKYIEESESYEMLLLRRGHQHAVPGVPTPQNLWYEPRNIEYKGDDASDSFEREKREALRKAADVMLEERSEAVATPAGSIAYDLDLARSWRKRKSTPRTGPKVRGFNPLLARKRRERSKREISEAVHKARIAGKFTVVPELDVEVARQLAGLPGPGRVELKGV